MGALRKPGLLEGLRVLDASAWQPGQHAAQLLCDLGAEVIKIEPPEGDRMRALADRFSTFNSNKRSAVADLKTEEGRARVLELAAEADVFIEGNRPGVADRLGVGYEALGARNPALVYCSISGYGQVGPLSDQGGHEHNFQAYAGAMSGADGGPPTSNLPVAGHGAATEAAFAIVSAVLCARRTGEGEHIDLSMTDVVASWVATMGAIDESRAMPIHRVPAGYGTFATADGRWVVLGVSAEDRLWDRLVEGLGFRELVGLAFADRAARSVELNDLIAGAVASRDRDELVAELAAAGVPISPVLSRAEMFVHPHFTARGLFTTAPDGTRALAHPVRYERHPARSPGRAPALGELGTGGWSTAG